ncbi:MAG: NADPH-dependent assimilatory sulfite reductase hemoprotein subunit [Planctomycetota bacterium]|nr:MAG: NADPH-dependent assimilatory sulfite reductase hemoprotein subunit [Planctomycetota bacterium]
MAETNESAPNESGLEKIKRESDYLRGTLADELKNDEPAFSSDSVQIVKFHGMYQQDNRDLRKRTGPDGKRLGKAYSLMVRIKLPGGAMTGDQLLAQIALADELGDTTLRITDRQDLQLHGILKKNIKAAIRRINEVQLTTLGACGDVNRNPMCCPAPLRHDGVRDRLQELAKTLSDHLLPQTTAYHEVWLTDGDSGEKELVGGGSEGHEIEPLYGPQYLPRKFKVAFALPDDNCTDVFTNDVGYVVDVQNGEIVGLHVFVGGGMGVTPSNANTFPAVAKPLTYVAVDEVIPLTEAILKVQRDFGNRADRKRARMKYLIADWGIERFREKVSEYYGKPLADPRPVDVVDVEDHLGRHPQGDGKWFYGLFVENGRLLDREGFTIKSAVREICETLRPNIRFTPQQNVLFIDLDEAQLDTLEAILVRHGVKRSEDVSTVRRWSMACVALPTCPLAVTESERALPGIMDKLEAELERLGLADERFTVRMTGCPNGCARPYIADIGLVGRTLGKYTIFLGGTLLGNRLAEKYIDRVPEAELVPRLVRVFELFRDKRNEGETFGDFCHRLGVEAIRRACGEED